MKHRPSRFSLFLCALALLPMAALAECATDDSWLSQACRHTTELWDEGGNDLYVPLHTYHLRSAYTSEQIARTNETPLGLGYGRSRYKDDRWEGLYAMVFLDSRNNPEPIVGYGYEWLWGAPQSLRAGLGYSLFVTARDDIYHYMPVPGILPIASLHYGKVSLNTTFIPGGSGFGSLFFFWSRVEF